MSTGKLDDGDLVDEPETSVSPSSAVVAAYLRDNPGFLCAYPDLVERLDVPHAVPGAVSLIEHQVRVLKESNADLRERLENLVRNARDNEEIGRRVQRLCLSLLGCKGSDEVFACVRQGFADEFQADFSAVRVFVQPRDPGDSRLGEFLLADDPSTVLLRKSVRAGKPVCGELDLALLQALFGDQALEIASGALVPLGPPESFGLLALCSRAKHRFKSSGGTVFLQQIGEIITHALIPHLKRS